MNVFGVEGIEDNLPVQIGTSAREFGADGADLVEAAVVDEDGVAGYEQHIRLAASAHHGTHIARGDDDIGIGAHAPIDGGVVEPFGVEQSFVATTADEALPMVVGIGGTERQGIVGDTTNEGFNIAQAENGVGIVHIARVAGVVEHQDAVIYGGRGLTELVEPDGGGEAEAVRGQGGAQAAQEGEIGRGRACGPVAVDLHFAHPAVAIVGDAHLLNAARDAVGQGVERGRSGVETGVDNEDHGDNFDAAGNGIAPLQGGNGHGLVGDLIGGDVEIAQIDFADVVAVQEGAFLGRERQHSAPIIDRRRGTRYGRRLFAAGGKKQYHPTTADEEGEETFHAHKIRLSTGSGQMPAFDFPANYYFFRGQDEFAKRELAKRRTKIGESEKQLHTTSIFAQ